MAYGYEDAMREDVLRMVPEDGKVIGSIGCGFAATEWELVKAGREVHGADIAAEVESVARQRLTSFTLLTAGTALPWGRESLDGLILADVLEHMPLAWERLKEFAELVRSGGWVVISVPNMRSWEGMREWWLKGDWPERNTGIFDRAHVQVMTHKRLARWCAMAGLEVERYWDRYDPNGPRRSWFFRNLDRATLRLMHRWLMYQIQCRCRRRRAGG